MHVFLFLLACCCILLWLLDKGMDGAVEVMWWIKNRREKGK